MTLEFPPKLPDVPCERPRLRCSTTKLSTTYLTYTVYAEKIQSWTNLETLGNLLYTTYFVLFLVSSLILLVAMIGAIVLTMHKTTQVKRQDVFRQNAIDFKNTIRKIRDI